MVDTWYYLDPSTGLMLTGWQQIEGKRYYFNPAPAPESGWVLDTNQGEWGYQAGMDLPYGAALRNTRTPDGHYADETVPHSIGISYFFDI